MGIAIKSELWELTCGIRNIDPLKKGIHKEVQNFEKLKTRFSVAHSNWWFKDVFSVLIFDKRRLHEWVRP